MALKIKHPSGMIDMMKVVESRVMEDYDKAKFDFPKNHHVLIVDLGEVEEE